MSQSMEQSKEPIRVLLPDMHPVVATALKKDGVFLNFNLKDTDEGATQMYQVNGVGQFTCETPKCGKHGWASGLILMVIRLYGRSKYNALVYGQRCLRCNKIGFPVLDDEIYIKRVTYRLKLWLGIPQDKEPYEDRGYLEVHQRELCEACLAGHVHAGARRAKKSSEPHEEESPPLDEKASSDVEQIKQATLSQAISALEMVNPIDIVSSREDQEELDFAMKVWTNGTDATTTPGFGPVEEVWSPDTDAATLPATRPVAGVWYTVNDVTSPPDVSSVETGTMKADKDNAKKNDEMSRNLFAAWDNY
ncbi:zinc-binding domain-containing protein [Xylariaceae sp. FL0255]|nr:zinc-binding domain-containing protein [Xylariaceae sp. FL0255]